MQAIASKPLTARADRATTVAPRLDWGYLMLFFGAAYLLAWLCFGVPILATRGLIAVPAPAAVTPLGGWVTGPAGV
jgi:hypothetical protein